MHPPPKKETELFRDIVFLVGTRFKTNEDRAPSAKVATRRIEGEATPPTSLPSPHLYRHHQCKRTAELPRPLSALPCSPSLCESVSLCVFVSRARFLFVGFVGFLAFLRSQSTTMMKAEEHFFPLFWVFLHSVGHQPPMSAPIGIQTILLQDSRGSFSAHLSRLGPRKTESLFVSLIPCFVINPKP